MKRSACVLVWVFVGAALAVSASAEPLIDPLIGVRGTDTNSQSLFDPTPQGVTACDAFAIPGPSLPPDYLCAPYNTEGNAVFSLDLRFFDELLQPFPVAALTVDTAHSDFPFMQALDGITVRLSNPFVVNGNGLPLQCDAQAQGRACPGFVVFTAAAGPGDVPASFVSVVGFNGVSTVPEPGMATLLGAALLGLMARRSRRG
jgi:hypothetical protein